MLTFDIQTGIKSQHFIYIWRIVWGSHATSTSPQFASKLLWWMQPSINRDVIISGKIFQLQPYVYVFVLHYVADLHRAQKLWARV